MTADVNKSPWFWQLANGKNNPKEIKAGDCEEREKKGESLIIVIEKL